jgi:hypothetical protein
MNQMSAANPNKLLVRDDLLCTIQYCGLFFDDIYDKRIVVVMSM